MEQLSLALRYVKNTFLGQVIASPEFPLCFLPLLAVYWLLNRQHRAQNIVLLIFGYSVYSMLGVGYAALLACYSFFVWGAGHFIETAGLPKIKKIVYSASVLSSLALLAGYKYTHFLINSLNQLLAQSEIDVQLASQQWMLPVGISFYTFMGISYLSDVYREKYRAASPASLLLFLCFSPITIAGPICRPSELLAQIDDPKPKSISSIDKILLLILSFVIKKVWIASWLAQAIVDPVFASPSVFNGFEVLLGVLAYSLQIFFDFSGYTDLARAVGMCLGYELPSNFDRPYLASSLSEFWGRWHITLSLWIRDYIYIPLGGSRRSFVRTLINLILAMALSGLWHGANITFLLWGLFHGLGLCLEKVFSRFGFKPNSFLLTYLFVCVGWVFFRSPNLEGAFEVFHSVRDWSVPLNPSIPHALVLAALAMSFFVWKLSPWLMKRIELALTIIPSVLKPLPFAVVISAVLALSPEGMPNFIYAQF